MADSAVSTARRSLPMPRSPTSPPSLPSPLAAARALAVSPILGRPDSSLPLVASSACPFRYQSTKLTGSHRVRDRRLHRCRLPHRLERRQQRQLCFLCPRLVDPQRRCHDCSLCHLGPGDLGSRCALGRSFGRCRCCPLDAIVFRDTDRERTGSWRRGGAK